jgi:hypothetical protein
MQNIYQEQARHEWGRVRRKAFLTQLKASLGHKNIGLVDFTQLTEHFNLGSASYRGVQPIALDKIVGSEGRYQDFAQAFLPLNESVSERWQKVATAYLNPNSRGLPPIEVCQIGDYYFVKDGNHRVSVARHLKLAEIEAHVWEYPQPVAGLAPGVDIDTLLLEAERQGFLAQTRLDELKPGHSVRFTTPGGYTDVLAQIAHYQEVLTIIDETETPYEKAVVAWYEMIYASTVQLIEQAGVLQNFPKRTAADFYIWVIQHHQQLEEHYSQPVMFEAVVKDIPKQHPTSRLARFWRSLQRRWKGQG